MPGSRPSSLYSVRPHRKAAEEIDPDNWQAL